MAPTERPQLGRTLPMLPQEGAPEQGMRRLPFHSGRLILALKGSCPVRIGLVSGTGRDVCLPNRPLWEEDSRPQEQLPVRPFLSFPPKVPPWMLGHRVPPPKGSQNMGQYSTLSWLLGAFKSFPADNDSMTGLFRQDLFVEICQDFFLKPRECAFTENSQWVSMANQKSEP